MGNIYKIETAKKKHDSKNIVRISEVIINLVYYLATNDIYDNKEVKRIANSILDFVRETKI